MSEVILLILIWRSFLGRNSAMLPSSDSSAENIAICCRI